VDEDHEVHDGFPFLVGHGAPGDGFGEAGRDAGGCGAEVFPGVLHAAGSEMGSGCRIFIWERQGIIA
jgi:hypothetical protein